MCKYGFILLRCNMSPYRCGEILFTPCIVSKKAYNKLSMHERGTMVEAYVGALYEQCSYRISQELSVVLETMISLLRHFVSLSGNHNSKQEPVSEPSSIELQTSQFKEHQHLKKAKSILLEVMQKRGVTNAGTNIFQQHLSFFVQVCSFLLLQLLFLVVRACQKPPSLYHLS
jgi:hypothetical protein